MWPAGVNRTMRRKNPYAAIDKEVERAFYAHCSGIQINVLDIQKVFTAGRTAALAGQDIATAVLAKVAELRQN